MSIDFRPLGPIRMADLVGGRLEHAGVRQHHCGGTSSNEIWLTDGRNFLSILGDKEGMVSALTSYFGDGAPWRILRAICDEFGVDIVSEHQPQFWGYETQEEWDAAWAKVNEEAEQDFYNRVVKFVRGEEHDIRPGTVGMEKAEIAKQLIAESPDLLAEHKRPDLIKVVEMIYVRGRHIIRLTDKELAFLRMVSMHEDDLPQA
jgi:hypothetical protein